MMMSHDDEPLLARGGRFCPFSGNFCYNLCMYSCDLNRGQLTNATAGFMPSLASAAATGPSQTALNL
jgi:hypothetical protein